MKPFLEHIATSKDSSWVLFNRQLESIPFEWHYNIEYELTLTLNSRGQRFIGDNVSSYDHGDLVLIGPRIPHTWCSNGGCSSQDAQPGRMHQALVLWFSEAFVKGIVEPHVELRPILKMLARSARALTFSEGARRKAQSIICEMPAQTSAERLLSLLKVLLMLAADTRATTLTSVASQSKTFPLPAEERIGRVVTYLHTNYREDISIERLARIATLSRSSLHRLFRLQTRMTVSDYIAQLRTGHACALLLNSDKPISLVAEEVGYCNLAHFNRQFKGLKNRTPRQFRSAFL